LPGSAPPRDHGFDAAPQQLPAQLIAVVASVGPQLRWAAAALEELVDERQQMPPLVLVARPDPNREGRAGRVYRKVEAAPRAAAERAADLLAPFFASTSEASTIARDQSANPSCSSSTRIRPSSCSHKPARSHSRKRRQHVCPDGHPSK
jgi:hypothetical protein